MVKKILKACASIEKYEFYGAMKTRVSWERLMSIV